MTTRHLDLTWSVSRGRETYGYNICRLDDLETGKRFRCMGGGYDMPGTVFAQWLAEEYHDELTKLDPEEFYGLTLSKEPIAVGFAVSARLNGASGLSSMLSIADALGLRLERIYNRRGTTEGWIVTSAAGVSS